MALRLKFVQATQRPLGATSGQQAGSSETKIESEAPGATKNSRDLILFSLKNRHVRASGSSRFRGDPAPRLVETMSAEARMAIPLRVLENSNPRRKGEIG